MTNFMSANYRTWRNGDVQVVTPSDLTYENWHLLYRYVSEVLRPERELCHEESDGLQCHLDLGHEEPHRADGVGRILRW